MVQLSFIHKFKGNTTSMRNTTCFEAYSSVGRLVQAVSIAGTSTRAPGEPFNFTA